MDFSGLYSFYVVILILLSGITALEYQIYSHIFTSNLQDKLYPQICLVTACSKNFQSVSSGTGAMIVSVSLVVG